MTLRSAATDNRAQTGQQLGKRERLDQVVIGSGIEPAHAIGNGIARGEKEDGNVAWRLAGPDPSGARSAIGRGPRSARSWRCRSM